jgi:hypothetical protein
MRCAHLRASFAVKSLEGGQIVHLLSEYACG